MRVLCLISHGGGPYHFMTGMVRALVVRAVDAASPAQPAPKAKVVIRLVDYAFVMDRPLTAGRHVIRVESKGAEPHEIGILKLAAGKTAADFQAWVQKPQGQPPLGESGGGIAALAPDLLTTSRSTLRPVSTCCSAS